MVTCNNCVALKDEISSLKEFLTEWFVILLHKVETHDKNLHDLTEVLYTKFSVENRSSLTSQIAEHSLGDSSSDGGEILKRESVSPEATENGGRSAVQPERLNQDENVADRRLTRQEASTFSPTVADGDGPVLNYDISLSNLLNSAGVASFLRSEDQDPNGDDSSMLNKLGFSPLRRGLASAEPSSSNMRFGVGTEYEESKVGRFPDATSSHVTKSRFSGNGGGGGGRPTSQIWKFFIVDPTDSSRAMCKVCSQTFSRGRCQRTRGTSNLIKHLKKHGAEFGEFQSASLRSKEERNSSLIEVPVTVSQLPRGASQPEQTTSGIFHPSVTL